MNEADISAAILLILFGALRSVADAANAGAFPLEAIDYPGGFDEDGQCVHICSESPNFTNKRNSKARDWDFILLEQMFLPQYCRLLEIGVDITVSHQDVTKSPDGIQCIPHRTTDTVTIHGLWPNYIQGYPACCNNQPGSDPFNGPLDPVNYAAVYPESHIFSAESMDNVWRDPAMPGAYESLCNIFNHEWQKHGYCLGYWNDAMNTTVKAATYFEFAILTASLVANATTRLNAWAADGAQPTVAEIRSLYPRRIELWCAAEDAEGARLNRFMAVRTCWNVSKVEWGPMEPMDCFAESPYGSFEVCDDSRPVRLDAYARKTTPIFAKLSKQPPGRNMPLLWFNPVPSAVAPVLVLTIAVMGILVIVSAVGWPSPSNHVHSKGRSRCQGIRTADML